MYGMNDMDKKRNYWESITSTATIFVDGFGGFAITDATKIHDDLSQHMKDESIWEAFDGVQNNERGTYQVEVDHWWEQGDYETGGVHEFVVGEPRAD